MTVGGGSPTLEAEVPTHSNVQNLSKDGRCGPKGSLTSFQLTSQMHQRSIRTRLGLGAPGIANGLPSLAGPHARRCLCSCVADGGHHAGGGTGEGADWRRDWDGSRQHIVVIASRHWARRSWCLSQFAEKTLGRELVPCGLPGPPVVPTRS